MEMDGWRWMETVEMDGDGWMEMDGDGWRWMETVEMDGWMEIEENTDEQMGGHALGVSKKSA